MNTELFIARRIYSGKNTHSISRPIINISVAGIVLGVTVMILTVAVVTGFKQEIRNKIIGFGSHIIISNYDSNSSYETVPIKKNQDFIPVLQKVQGIMNVQPFALKAGIIKTHNDIQGVLLKGVGSNYDWDFIKDNLKECSVFNVNDTGKTDKVVISEKIASTLKLRTGDHLTTYFVQQPPRVRKFVISGIFKSSLEDFDKLMICDISHIQKLNDWSSDQVTGFEIRVNDFDMLDKTAMEVQSLTGSAVNADGSMLKVETINEKYPQVFDWINLINTNTWIILILMLTVAGFNMISGLLILILERTNMIGILKAMGTENWSIRKVFLYNAAFITGRGILFGNMLGAALYFLQLKTQFIRLDPATYYVSFVPVNLKILHLLLLNLGTIVATVSMLVLPSYLITRISPDRAIRFE